MTAREDWLEVRGRLTFAEWCERGDELADLEALEKRCAEIRERLGLPALATDGVALPVG